MTNLEDVEVSLFFDNIETEIDQDVRNTLWRLDLIYKLGILPEGPATDDVIQLIGAQVECADLIDRLRSFWSRISLDNLDVEYIAKMEHYLGCLTSNVHQKQPT